MKRSEILELMSEAYGKKNYIYFDLEDADRVLSAMENAGLFERDRAEIERLAELGDRAATAGEKWKSLYESERAKTQELIDALNHHLGWALNQDNIKNMQGCVLSAREVLAKHGGNIEDEK